MWQDMQMVYGYPQEPYSGYPPFMPEGPAAEPNTAQYPELTAFDYFQKPPQPDHLIGMLNGPNGQGAGEMETNSFLQYFRDEQGGFDIDKIFSTTGKLTSMYRQVSPLALQLAGFFKGLGSN